MPISEPTITPPSKGFVIAPIAKLDDPGLQRFKSESMALVRSIEQQYWSLAQQHAHVKAAEKAVEMGEKILKREEAELELSRGGVADLAEAAQRLEQFRLDLKTRTSDEITTEGQFRKLLGLPPADDRRIVPITAPIAASSSRIGRPCFAEMLEHQPDILRNRRLLKDAEAKAVSADHDVMRDFLPELADLGPFAPSDGPANETLCRQRACLEQVIHQTTHSLARFFLEIDANYKQYEVAKRNLAAALERLDAQRAFYDEGRITIDRFLDAVSQYTTAPRPGGAVPGELQHLDRRARRGERDAARLRQNHRGGRPQTRSHDESHGGFRVEDHRVPARDQQACVHLEGGVGRGKPSRSS